MTLLMLLQLMLSGTGERAVLFIDRCALIPAASKPVLVLQRNTAEAEADENALPFQRLPLQLSPVICYSKF